MVNKGIQILLFFILVGNHLIAQQKIDLPFYKISTIQGLSQSTVFVTFQDSNGYIWFGTSDGLNRYDGFNFKIYRHIPNDPKSLTANEILAINEDDNGNIWVGTRNNGLSVLNVKTQLFDNEISKKIGIKNNGVNTLINDKKGNIWLSSGNLGLFKYNTKTETLKSIKIENKVLTGITAGYLDNTGNIIIAYNQYDFAIINKKTTLNSLKIVSGSPSGSILGMTSNKQGNIYFCTSNNGLYEYDLKSNSSKNIYYIPGQQAGTNNIKMLVCDKANNLYAATDDGLLIFDHNNYLTNVTHQKSNSNKRFGLSTHALQSIFIDKNENIWIGTWEGGLNVNYKKEAPFKLIRQETGENNGPLQRKITSVASNNSKIWLGTNTGLSVFDRSTKIWKHFSETAIGGHDINALKFDNENDLFISSYLENLSVYNQTSGILRQYDFKSARGYQTASVSSFALSQAGKMWLGTNNNGVYLFDKKTGQFEALSKRFPSLQNQGITCLLHDSANRLWLGSVTNGLICVNLTTNHIKNYQLSTTNKNAINSNHILALYETLDHKIWIGTNGGGLNQYNEIGDNFVNYTMNDGLPNNTIKSIIEDHHKNLWLSTNFGICNFNLKNKTFKNYTEADGLQGREFGRNVGSINNAGEIFFGGTNGLSFFNPKDLSTPKNQIPKIVFSDFKLFNKTVDINEKSPLKQDISKTKNITLKHQQSVFTIEFNALDFQLLKNNKYAYKLVGFDKEWNEIGTIRAATYTNLHEGNYVFKVKSTDNYGHWVNNEVSLNIEILAPWYRSIWAYIMYVSMLVGGLLLWKRLILIKEKLQADARIQRIETLKVKELDAAKTNFFTNISHEFRTPLTLIISPLQQLINNSEKNISTTETQTKHKLILKNAQRLLALINQILDISKIESGNLKLEITKNDISEFLNTISLSFSELAKQKEIDFKIKIKCNPKYIYFDKDIIDKITNNLLSNAFKFTPAGGSILFEAHVEINQLNIKVEDNGLGMSAEAMEHIFERYYQANGQRERKTVGSGIGLALCKELAELHKGNINAKSTENIGSQFFVSLPINYESFDPILIKENFEFEQNQILPFQEQIINTELVINTEAPILLIVEDNDELREYLASLFTLNYQIYTASNGQEGLEIARKYLPDTIISDLMMPIMDGAQLCDAIKSDEITSHIPFVMLTSRQATQSINQSYDLGADDYILKPFNSDILIKKINNIIKTRQQLLLKYSQKNNEPLQGNLPKTAEEKFIDKIRLIVEANIHDSAFDVSALENKLNLSKMQLYRKLKAISSMAPIELIRSIRLNYAHDLLLANQHNISEVAYAVGFNDPAYFTRAFRKEFGKTPSEILNSKM